MYSSVAPAVASTMLGSIQSSSGSLLQDPRVQLSSSMPSSSAYQSMGPSGTYGSSTGANLSSNPSSGSLPSNVANILNPRNTEMLQSLLAKLNTGASQTNAYANGQPQGANTLLHQGSSTNQPSYTQQHRLSTGYKPDGVVQQDFSSNLLNALQKAKQPGILPLPNQSNQSIPAYTPQNVQYPPQNYLPNQNDQQISFC
jgi:hypothetical protein